MTARARAAPPPVPESRPGGGGPVQPASGDIPALTDKYFLRTKEIVGKFGDCRVTYAVFMRRPVISAPRLAVEWLHRVAAERGTSFDIELNYPEGKWVGAGEPLMYVAGSLYHLADLETLYLQLLGPPSNCR